MSNGKSKRRRPQASRVGGHRGGAHRRPNACGAKAAQSEFHGHRCIAAHQPPENGRIGADANFTDLRGLQRPWQQRKPDHQPGIVGPLDVRRPADLNELSWPQFAIQSHQGTAYRQSPVDIHPSHDESRKIGGVCCGSHGRLKRQAALAALAGFNESALHQGDGIVNTVAAPHDDIGAK